MLSTFPPQSSGWDTDDADSGRRDGDTLLDMCARSGNAPAVERLVRCGAALDRGVLHALVDESVRDPTKVGQLVDVYRTIVDSAVAWRCLKSGGRGGSRCPEKDSTIYRAMLREAMLHLTTLPRPDDKCSVIERAIEIGAGQLLLEILNTRGVYQLDSVDDGADGVEEAATGARHIYYDVTDLISAKTESNGICGGRKNKNKTEDNEEPSARAEFRRYRPQQSYFQHLIETDDKWKDSDIFKRPPFRQLTKPMMTIVQRAYVLCSFFQMAFMVSFSNLIPETCSLSARFQLNLTQCSPGNGSNETTYPAINSDNGLTFAWVTPLIVSFVVKAVVADYLFLKKRAQQRRKARDDGSVGKQANSEALLLKLLSRNTDILSVIAFCLAAVVWYYINMTHFASFSSVFLIVCGPTYAIRFVSKIRSARLACITVLFAPDLH